MPQVVLKQVAVGVVVDQIAVDIRQVPRTEQVAHLTVGAAAVVAERQAVTQGQGVVEGRGEGGIEAQIRRTLDPVVEGVDRLAVPHPVAADQLVPIDLRIARIGCKPCPFGFEIARIARQVAVVVRHGCAGVVPVEHAVTREARLPAEIDGQGGLRRERQFVTEGQERKELPAHAGVADTAVLVSPGGVVEAVTGQGEGLLGGGEARAARRGRKDAEQRKAVIGVPGMCNTQGRGHRVGEDALHMQVAARAGIEGQRSGPAAAQIARSGDLRAHEVIAVGEAHRGQEWLQGLLNRKVEEPDTARTARQPGRGDQARIAGLPGTQQAQHREVAVGKLQSRKRDALGIPPQAAAFHGDLREVEVGQFAVEVHRRLDGPVEERRIGSEQLAPLLPFGIGIVLVVKVLRSGRKTDRQQAQQQQDKTEHGKSAFGRSYRVRIRKLHGDISSSTRPRSSYGMPLMASV